jgi:hypothetical protein
MLIVLSIFILRQRHIVADDTPICSVNLSSDIIGSGSGRFILKGKIFRDCEQDCEAVPVVDRLIMDINVERLPTDFIAASHVARVAIQLANIGMSKPEQELSRAWRLIVAARGMVREHAAFRPLSTEHPKPTEQPEAEFVSLPGPGKRCPISGLSRSTLYQLAALGKIRMISLRREGNARGKRLVAVESVRHYLRMLDAQQNPPDSA